MDDDPNYIHDLDVSVWVGKSGPANVVDELEDQLANRPMVKIRVLPAARHGSDVDEIAESLAEEVGGRVEDVRGHTVVIGR